MEMRTYYFDVKCLKCGVMVAERIDNETMGGIQTAQRKARAHLRGCRGPQEIYRDGELHSAVLEWLPTSENQDEY